MTLNTSTTRLNYLAAYRLLRLGACVPWRTDPCASLAVWAADCAYRTAYRPDPLAVPRCESLQRLRAWRGSSGRGAQRVASVWFDDDGDGDDCEEVFPAPATADSSLSVGGGSRGAAGWHGAARRDYLAAWHLRRLGARVLRTDAGAPLAVRAADCAYRSARTPDPLTTPLRARWVNTRRRRVRDFESLCAYVLDLVGADAVQDFGDGWLEDHALAAFEDEDFPVAGPAAPAGLPAAACAPPAQPDPSSIADRAPCAFLDGLPVLELDLCAACAGTGRVRVCSFAVNPPDEWYDCPDCDGSGLAL